MPIVYYTVRDYAEVKFDGNVSKESASLALDMLNADCIGLDHLDRKLLETLIKKFDGGPVGLDSLAAALSEEKGTLRM